MKIQEKLTYIQDNHFSEWLKMRAIVAEEVSLKCSMFCVCGRLCTGMHENHCRKFQDKINSETVKRLSHLIEKITS